ELNERLLFEKKNQDLATERAEAESRATAMSQARITAEEALTRKALEAEAARRRGSGACGQPAGRNARAEGSAPGATLALGRGRRRGRRPDDCLRHRRAHAHAASGCAGRGNAAGRTPQAEARICLSSGATVGCASLERDRSSKNTQAALTLAALGVVFGDIGTSPLYAVKETFSPVHGIPLTPPAILGGLSTIFWS